MATKSQWFIDINYAADPERTPAAVRKIVRNTLGKSTRLTGNRVVVASLEDAILARLNLDANIEAVGQV